MAVKASYEVTVTDQTDAKDLITWYQLSASATKPNKPTTTSASATPSGWTKAEPSYDPSQGTKYLYTCQQLVWGDGTCGWGDVQLSSSYEAAKSAVNAAASASASAASVAEAIGIVEAPYTEVEWVESNGTQFVYLDWKPPINTWGFEADFIIRNAFNTTQAKWNEEENVNNAGFLFGTRNATGVNDIELGSYSASGFLRIGNATAVATGMKTDKTRQTIKLIGTTLTKPNGTTATVTRVNETANKPYCNMAVFAYHEGLRRGGTGYLLYPSTSRIYSLKFYEGTTVKVHLVGAIRNRDGMTGLYDKVADHFYPAANMTHGDAVGPLGEVEPLVRAVAKGQIVTYVDNRTITRMWHATIPELDKLEDGQKITVIFSSGVSGSKPADAGLVGWDETATSSYSNVFLKLTLADGSETEWVPCYYSNGTRLTTHYASGTPVLLTYRENVFYNATTASAGTAVMRGWWADPNYVDGNTTYTKYSDTVIAGKNGLKVYTLCMKDDEDNWTTIVNQSSTGASDKTCYTGGLKLGNVLYHATNGNYAAGANGGQMWETYGGIDFRRDANGITDKQATTELQLRKPIYFVGTIHDDGLFYLDTTKWWTQDPNDGSKVYVLVGSAYSSYNAIFLAADNPTYVVRDGELVEITDSRFVEVNAELERQDGVISLKADAENVYTKQAANALLEVKANKATLTSEINASADTVKIDASRVNIEGAAIFSSGRLSETSLNSAFDPNGAAQDAYSKIQSRGEQLITNGNGFMGDNTNFSSLVFDGSVANGSPGSFTRTTATAVTIASDEFFPVDPSKVYRAEFDVKCGDDASVAAGAKMYAMLTMYDVDKKPISAQHIMWFAGTTTTLARELKAGDTKVYLADASNWKSTSAPHQRALIFWNYTNSFGYTYPPETYSRNFAPDIYANDSSVDKANGVITLKASWTGATFPAGTPVSQNHSGSGYAYFWYHTSQATFPTDWYHVSGTYSGTDISGNGAGNKFWPGTAYCKFGWLWNYQASSSSSQQEIWVTNISVKEAVATSAELSEVTANAVKRTQRIYYRKSSSGAPAAPGTASTNWVTQTGDVFGQWTTKVPRLTSNADGTGTKYLYLYTCEQREMGDGTLAYTTVLLDDSNTIIDGGTIITGTIDANNVSIVNLAKIGGNTDYAEVTAAGTEVVQNGDSVAKFGTTTRIGATDGPHIVIEEKGADFYGTQDGARLAHLGYDIGNTESGTSRGSYYRFGRDRSAHEFSPWTNYSIGEHVIYESFEYVCIAPTVGDWTGEENWALSNGIFSMSEGQDTTASGYAAHAEGGYSVANGSMSHAEGYDTAAFDNGSHAEGWSTTASGQGSHAEGGSTLSSAYYSHAEGFSAKATGDYSHAQNVGTIAAHEAQTTIGKYNSNQSANVFEIGNGTGSNRSNAFAVAWDGTTTHDGDVAWTNLPLNSATAAYDSDSTPRYRRWGQVVALVGAVKPKSQVAAGGTLTIGTLPTGCRPPRELDTLCQGSGGNVWMLRITTAGVATAERYRSGSTNAAMPTTAWLTFSVTFMV